MSWIDIMQDDRWTREALQARAEKALAYLFPDAERLRLRAHAVATGIGFMDAADKARWEAFVAAQGELQRQVDAEFDVMQALDGAFEVEAARLALRSIPADEEILPGDDEATAAAKAAANADLAAQRAQAQAALDALQAAASPEVQAMLSTRNRYPAEPAPLEP